MTTLKQMNERLEAMGYGRREWDNLTLKIEYVISTMNRRFQGYHSSGSALHLATMETVIEQRNPQPGKVKVGDIFSVQPMCNGNGQRRGDPIQGKDTSDVTCRACLKHLDRISKMIAKEVLESLDQEVSRG